MDISLEIILQTESQALGTRWETSLSIIIRLNTKENKKVCSCLPGSLYQLSIISVHSRELTNIIQRIKTTKVIKIYHICVYHIS